MSMGGASAKRATAEQPSPVVAIGIPSNGTWRDQFGWCLSQMLIHTMRAAPEVRINLIGEASSSLARNRGVIAHKAIQSGATHLLCLDTDMVFPVDTLLRLLARNKPVVGAVCVARHNGKYICGMTRRTGKGGYGPEAFERLSVKPGDTGLRQVWAIGLAVTMLHTSVFEQIDMPWFAFPWDYERGFLVAEDEHFAIQLDRAGVEVYADLDLSWQVGHIGAAVYTLQAALGTQSRPTTTETTE